MEKELLNFIKENDLSPFEKTDIRKKKNKILRTREAKKLQTRMNNKISSNFQFEETKNLLKFFYLTNNKEIIIKRQIFFNKIKKMYDNEFLKKLNKPRKKWYPQYSVMVVTSDEETYEELKDLNCPVKLLLNEDDLYELENYEVVQVIDCEDFSRALEQLPSTIFLNSIDEVYLERFLEELSGWEHNFSILKNNETNNEINKIINNFNPLLSLLKKESDSISREEIETRVEEVNEEIQKEIEGMDIPGNSLYDILSRGEIPEKIKNIIEEKINNKNLPQEIINVTLPVSIDEQALDNYLRREESEIFSNFSEEIKKNTEKLRQVKEKLKKLSNLLLLYDFISGISQFSRGKYPKISSKLSIVNGNNIFLENPQQINFSLIKEKASILTGANSGGKTTLLEHILQVYILLQMGLPTPGETEMPLFTKIYYFSKEKGTISKGAFESLLFELSKIDPKKGKTLILADEIEAVTEPGLAGDIIVATVDYFLKKNCYLVIATHLGQEIKDKLPKNSRLDGIEAVGLDDNHNLIVDHNPIPYKLASSTPQLIVKKLAKTEDNQYFDYLYKYLNK